MLQYSKFSFVNISVESMYQMWADAMWLENVQI